ncbi:hypothetical protein POX_c04759 [Penicillium oxalicum]|uniref:hypothetical protein n=1 Tax=Penicillium oxalicum TaxID=69781 RepID=UPI0020B82962|nr:hypothetical protein POX_c04759 [Penicillium oxalicum]KAI2791879.1 hypothetical protein POX_c04759 [Penicillium oxalicum]
MHFAESSYVIFSEGDEFTTDAKPRLRLQPETWVITAKLGEYSLRMYQKDIEEKLGPGFAFAKYLCFRKGDQSRKQEFMRIYQQIPTVETEYGRFETRAEQAVPPIDLPELKAFVELTMLSCPVVPRLLGYQEGTQGKDGRVPGGFLVSVVWEKVPGEPLSQGYFWSLEFEHREAIRQEFRRVYEQLVRCGIRPCIATLSKLIYDQSSGKISAARINPDTGWSNTNFPKYGLAELPPRQDWQLHESEWKY